MKKIANSIYFLLLMSVTNIACNTLPERVVAAEAEKGAQLRKALIDKGLQLGKPIYFRAFKSEKILELYVQDSMKQYILFHSYPICAASGALGAKRREGDKQVPEGVYHINRFNPKSDYHLSLGLDYPNPSDLRFCDATKPGGDIFIHGGCASIGCLAMTDDAIKELYLLAQAAKEKGQIDIPVHIFPFRNPPNTPEKSPEMSPEKSLENANLWVSLLPIMTYFDAHKTLPNLVLGNDGYYKINS